MTKKTLSEILLSHKSTDIYYALLELPMEKLSQLFVMAQSVIDRRINEEKQS